MNCLIVDDNPMARSTLSHLCSQVTDLKVIRECCNAIEAYNFLQSDRADILFLDIEMPEMSGLELTRCVGREIIIIFTTSKKDYAVDGFDLNIADYLTKPIAPARFLQAVGKAREIYTANHNHIRQAGDEFIFVRDTAVTRLLRYRDILYLEAMGDYVKFHTLQKVYAIHGTLKAVEERLPMLQFIRVHRSFIVAVDKVDTIENGGLAIGSRFVPVADSYRKALNERMNIF
jgi:DNA-binding LytR/AlgR family response regulator